MDTETKQYINELVGLDIFYTLDCNTHNTIIGNIRFFQQDTRNRGRKMWSRRLEPTPIRYSETK